MRMTAAEVATLVDGRLVGSPAVELSSAEVDSRRLRPGGLFVALPGARVDGHDFVAQALTVAGAALVRTDRELPPPPSGRAMVQVADPLAAYHRLARHERDRRAWEVVAITGSVAKTTTKDFVASLVAEARETGASEGNRNSTLGLPAQLLSQPESLEVFVAEAGMSRAGELDRLGSILRPTRLLYTRLAEVHTEFFADGMAGVVAAKAELLEHLVADGVLVVNATDPHQDGFSDRVTARVVRYGVEGSAAWLEKLEDRGLLGSRFQLHVDGDRVEVELPLAGRHQADNLVAAAACAATLGLAGDQIAAAAGRLQAAARRGRVLRRDDGVTLVDDSYNSSPTAVRQLLDLLLRAPGRRVAVLGEMYELGATAAGAHREVGGWAAEACDLLLAVGGELAGCLADGAREAGMTAAAVLRCGDAEAAADVLCERLVAGDVVLVKGSRGVGLDRTVDRVLGREAA